MWCERHKCWKTRQWQKLCQTRADYRRAWDEGRGPGQVKGGTPGKTTVTRKPAQQPRRTKGVGDHLKDVTAELGITMKQGCSCASLAAEMNRRGPDGCRAKREKLVAEMVKNAQRYSWGDVAWAAVNAVKTGLAWHINPLDPYGSLLDEAIRRAETAVA